MKHSTLSGSLLSLVTKVPRLSDQWRETEAVTAPHRPSLERGRVGPRVEGTSGAVDCWCFRERRQEATLQGARRFGVAGPAS
jgi:hypothetical protein